MAGSGSVIKGLNMLSSGESKTLVMVPQGLGTLFPYGQTQNTLLNMH